MSSTRPVTLAISTVALVVMSACGGSSTTPAAAPSSSTTSSTSSPSASQTAAAPTGPATVQVATTTLGRALTDSRGFTLYKFDKDQGGTSVCYEAQDCAVHWPALLTAGAPKASTGADAAMLGTTKRKDGATQVTYNKMPLYTYYLDQAPGDVRGQGVFGLWWLVAPDGTLIKTTASPT